MSQSLTQMPRYNKTVLVVCHSVIRIRNKKQDRTVDQCTFRTFGQGKDSVSTCSIHDLHTVSCL